MSAVKAAVATVSGAGSVAAAFVAVGWPAIAAAVGLAVLVLAETAWVLSSLERCHRLVMVIVAVRGGGPQPLITTRQPPAASD